MQNVTENIRYDDFLRKWLDYHKNFIKKSTYSHYLFVTESHVIEELGHYKINEINNNILQKFTLQKLESGRIKQKGGLSPKAVKDILIVVKSSLFYAIRKEYIPAFDMRIIFPREIKDKKLKTFTPNEQKILTEYLLNNMNSKNIGLLICLYSGIRIGELCALQWENIDRVNKCIRIEKTLQRIYIKSAHVPSHTEVIITSPKSSSSIRKIPIPPFIFKELLKLNLPEKAFVNTATTHHTEPRIYRDYYRRLLKKLDIEFKNFHSLRHTFATRCIEMGVDYKTVADLMGHSSVNTTLNLYVHSNFSQKKSAINKLFQQYSK